MFGLSFSVHPEIPEKVSKRDLATFVSFLLLRAQKKKQEKGTPASPGPAGFPCFSTRAGRGKTRASPSDSSRVFSALACEARQDKWGRGKTPIGTPPSTGEAAEKGICTA
jgi:hypothetical protein